MKTYTIPLDIYEALPASLKEVCLYFSNEQERDAFLLAALTITGSSLSNLTGTFNGQAIYPNLQLLTLYHQPIQAIQAATLLAYKLDKKYLNDYKQDKVNFNKGKIRNQPINQQKLVPADSSFIHILNTMESRSSSCIMHNFEDKPLPAIATDKEITELLDKSFYNEPYYYHFVANGQNICIDHLKLSTLLSSSFEALHNILPGKEHTLYPNLCYCTVDITGTNPAEPFEQNGSLETVISPLFDYVYWLSKGFNYYNNYNFTIDTELQTTFLEYSEDFSPQLTMTFYRIAMIISIFNIDSNSRKWTRHVRCNKAALVIAYFICFTLQSHSFSVGSYLEEHSTEQPPRQIAKQLTEEEQMAASLHEQGLSLRKIAGELYRDESKFMKVKRILTRIGRAA